MAEFVLKLEPADRVVFSSKKLGEEQVTTTLKIQNPTKDKFALKIKCTSNELFRIRPPVSTLKANDSVSINLIFNSGKSVPESGNHYFVVHYIKITEDKPARALWADHTGEPLGMKRLTIDFKKGDEKDKPKEDKKEDKADAKKSDKKEDEKKDEDKKKEEEKEEKKEEKEDKKEDEKKDEEKKDDEKKEE